MKTETIQSLKELQSKMPAIIKQFGSNNSFTQIALANPIVALERAGFQFTEGAKEEIEHYVRFGKEGLDKLHLLKEDIYKLVGGDVNLDKPELLADTLIRILPQPGKDATAQYQKEKVASHTNINRDIFIKIFQTNPIQKDGEWNDDLQQYSKLHPVIPLLIEYRKMQAKNPRFAPPEKITVIEERLKNGPLKNVVFSLIRNNNR